MKKKRLLVLSVVVATCASAAAFVSRSHAESAAQAPLLRIGMVHSAVSTLDIARDTSGNGGTLDDLGMESLLRFNPDGSLRPWLATRVTRPGRAVYVYHLRRGVRFWNGNEMTATDVANALNYYRHPEFHTVSSLKSVKSVVARDRYTVVVTLRHPDASFQSNLPGRVIFEKRFQEQHGEKMGQPGVLMMGTGPWKFDSFNPATGAELSANPRWWGGEVPYRRISFKYFATEQSMALAMRSGDIDVVPFVFAPQSFGSTSGQRVQSKPHCSTWNFAMPVKNAPWNDIHVRRAVAYAINKNDIVKAYGGFVQPASTPFPVSHLRALGSTAQVNAVLKSLPQYPYNLAKARAELAQSRYPNGFSADLDGFEYGSTLNVLQAIAGNLKQIGINLTVKNMTLGAWIQKMVGPRDKVGAILLTYGCISPDISYYPNVFLTSKNAKEGGFNTANYTPAQIDTWVAEAQKVSAGPERLALYQKIMRMVLTDVPYVPVINLQAAYAHQPRFTWDRYSYFDSLQGPWALDVKPR